MMLRRCRRAVALAITLLGCIVRLALKRLLGPLGTQARAEWLQDSCRKVLGSAGVAVRVSGVPPDRGLLVANHLSYLDIAVFGAAAPCAFVAKKEISRWPYFGTAARGAGTIFIERGKRASTDAVALEIAGRLHQPVPILVFPEGTSSDGSRVLRFHSSLFEPAVAAGAPITAAAVRYAADGNIPERDLCWFGDEEFLPHVWRTLGVRGLRAEVTFGEPRTYPDRRTATKAAHDEVSGMRHDPVGVENAEEMHAANEV